MKTVEVHQVTRIPRRRKKAIRRTQIVYNINSAPRAKGLSMEGVMKIFMDYGVLLWDSANEGATEPKLIPITRHTKTLDIKSNAK